MIALKLESSYGDDTVTFKKTKDFNNKNVMEIAIDNPCAGDTETGIGRNLSIFIDRQAINELKDFLNRIL